MRRWPVSDPWVFVLATLAAYRLTRLVTTDTITEPIFDKIRFEFERRWYEKHGPEGSNTHFNSRIAYMLACTWCTGFWVSGVLSVILSLVYGFDYLVIVGWFAMATGVGLLGKIGDS